MSGQRGAIVIIDPARHTPELDGFNRLARTSPLPLTYHLPAMHSMDSLQAEDMTTARGVIIFGSASSVNERLPWQLQLEEWLMPHLQRGLPTLGICYGHQMLAYMFGGKVDYVFPDQRKHLGSRTVVMNATSCWPKAEGQLLVSHNEMVVLKPKDMTVIARSDTISIDGLAHNQLPVWSLQPHPEATLAFLKQHQLSLELDHSAFSFGHDLVDRFIQYAASHPI